MTDLTSTRTYWLTDEPVNLADSDAFHVSELVDRLVVLLQAAKPPFTVSLSGTWGVGKSTIAEALIERLHPIGIPGVLVDAWTEDIEHLRRSLVIAVGAELRGGPEHRTEIAEQIDSAIHVSRVETLPPKPELRLLESIRDIRRRPEVFTWFVALDLLFLLLVVASSRWLPATTGAFSTLLGASLVFTALQSGFFFRIETTSQSRAAAVESVETAERFRRLVTTRTSGAPPKVVVVVDNLDRLEGADALRALAEIRALVELENSLAIFVVPIDRGALARHIEPTLAPGTHEEAEGRLAGKDYLEKFFNLDLLLTKPEIVDLRDWALIEARSIFPAEDVTDLTTAVQVIASAAAGSPRAIKRILNAMSSRHRLIDPHTRPRPSLAQLAFVDGLLTQFPDLLDWLARDPREFLTYRTDLGEEREASARVPLQEWREIQLRAYLLTNGDIPLTASLLRTVLSLRQDRVWRDVSDPSSIQEALDTGQGGAYRAALDALDASERALAVSRSVGYIERSVPRFVRDAVTNLLAIAESVGEYEPAAAALHPLAVRAFRETDNANRRRATRELGRFLFGTGGVSTTHLADLAGRFVAALAESPGAAPEGLIWTVREGSSFLAPAGLSTAQQALEGVQDETLAPIFDPPINRSLSDGPIAASYVGRLTAWDPSSAQEPVQVAITRLRALTEDGWNDPDGMRQVCARAATQIPLVADRPEPFRSLLGIVRLARTAPAGEEVDSLGAALVTAPGTYELVERYVGALWLPVSSQIKPTIASGLNSWLSSVQPELAEQLVLPRDAASAFGFDPRPVLVRRWAAGEGRRWAELASEFDDGSDPELLASVIGSASDSTVVGLAAESAGIAESRKDATASQAVVDALAKRCASLPPALIAMLGGTLNSLTRNNADISPITRAIETRIAAESTIGPLVQAIRKLQEAGVSQSVTLARPLAVRGAAAAGVETVDIPWLARLTKGSNESRQVLIRAIETSAVSELGPIVDEVAPSLRRHAAVSSALARRAAAVGTEQEAATLLTSAQRYSRPSGLALAAFRKDLTSVAQQWPALDGLVNKLQG
jgi:KAP family P-loop domain